MSKNLSSKYPKNNTTREGIITNMCYTYDHSFGMNSYIWSGIEMGYSDSSREILWNQMAQIFDNDIAPFMQFKER